MAIEIQIKKPVIELGIPGPAGTSIELDPTLTQSGKAADAKAVGDALNGKQGTLIQSGAAVGQIAKITAVDSSGKPTAWQAVDMPSGGGGEPYFNVNVVDLNSDEQGVGYLTLDATNEQIYTAYESGKHVLINILGLANAQVQKNQDGALYAIVFMPQTTGTSGLTKLRVYFLEAMNPKWKMSVSYISMTNE